MLFNSIDFWIFFPVVTLIYAVIPRKIRCLWLLIASYYFYMCWNAGYAVLIAFSTCITYAAGLMIEKLERLPLDKEMIALESGITLQADGVKDNRIVKVLLTLPESSGQTEETAAESSSY